MTVTPTTAGIIIGNTTQLTATARSAAGAVLTGRPITWSSSAAAVATVDANGVVTGVAAGTASVTATSEGKTGTATITVQADIKPVASIAIAPPLDTLEAFSSELIGVVLRDAEGNLLFNRPVQWTVSNPAVAVIDPVEGMLSGVDRGNVTVTATSEGKSATAKVEVVIKYRSISAGSEHSCGITTDNRAYCWGHGDWGQLANGTGSSDTPKLVSASLSFAKITAGPNFTCGITTGGETYCWGANSIGQLGDGKKIAYGNVYNVVGQKPQ